MERSGALELSRDDEYANCLLEFEFAGCLLRVLLERDDNWFSRSRVLEFTEFDWSREANDVEKLRESFAALAAAAVSVGFESRDALLACAIRTVSSHSSVHCDRSRCKYSREDESASPAMKWSTASDNCASVENGIRVRAQIGSRRRVCSH